MYLGMPEDEGDKERYGTTDGDEEESGMPDGDEEEMFLSDEMEEINRPLIELLFEYGSKYQRWVMLGILTSIIAPVVGILPPYILRTAIDAVLLENEAFALFGIRSSIFPTGQTGQMYLLGTVLAVIGIFSAILSWASGWLWGRFSQEVQHEVRVDTYAKAQELGMSFYESEQTGQIMTVLNNDIRELNSVLGEYIGQVIGTFATIGGVAILLFSLQWEFALVSLIFVPGIIVVSAYFVARLKIEHAAVKQRIGAVNSRIENNVSGMEVIKSYTGEERERGRVAEASRALYDRLWNVIDLQIKFQPSLGLLNTAGFTVVLMVGALWVVNGPPLFFSQELTEGTLVAFLVYQQRLIQPIVQVGSLIDRYFDAQASAIRVLSLHGRDVHRVGPDDPVDVDRFDGTVEVNDLTFSYDDDEAVLEDIDFTAEAGDFVGIVGSTGSGKSTLLKLMLRFYDPDEGEIRMDGHDISDIDIETLRDRIGVVHQDVYLFSGTIRENVSYGASDPSEQEVERAARLANAHGFITDLPEGYDTTVGEGGSKLSGGQRQRIALARALVSEPDLLLLDEATSHVDNETERLIQESLATVVEDRTTFAIAHRLSTIRNADKIIVLDDGEIIENGTHQELLDREGKYAELWSIHVGDRRPSTSVET